MVRGQTLLNTKQIRQRQSEAEGAAAAARCMLRSSTPRIQRWQLGVEGTSWQCGGRGEQRLCERRRGEQRATQLQRLLLSSTSAPTRQLTTSTASVVSSPRPSARLVLVTCTAPSSFTPTPSHHAPLYTYRGPSLLLHCQRGIVQAIVCNDQQQSPSYRCRKPSRAPTQNRSAHQQPQPPPSLSSSPSIAAHLSP